MKDTKQYIALLTQAELSSIDAHELIERFQNGDTEAFNPLVLQISTKESMKPTLPTYR